MMTKDLPLERDYKHWKELYEMLQRKRETEIRQWQDTVAAWQNHAMTLSAAMRLLMSKSK